MGNTWAAMALKRLGVFWRRQTFRFWRAVEPAARWDYKGVVLGLPAKITGIDRDVGSPLRRSFGQIRVTVFVFEHLVVAGMDG